MAFQFTGLKKHENQAHLLSALYPAFVQGALQKSKFNFGYPMGLGLPQNMKTGRFGSQPERSVFSV